MSLGYALVHPLQVEATLGRNALKLGFDDGIDVVLGGIGVGDVGAARQAVEDELQGQLDDIVAQFEALLHGPLAGLMSLGDILDADEVDWAAIAEQASAFLCNLEPAVVHGLLTGLLNQVSGAVPVFQPAEFSLRAKAIATAAIGTLEAPLLSGRDDMAAHRGYRSAAMLRLLLRPLFDQLDVVIAGLDPLGALRSAIDEVPNLDEAIVTMARAAGCWVHDNVVPFLQCLDEFQFSATIEGDGPSGMPDFTTRQELVDFDSRPAPHDHKHPLWWVDLATGAIGLIVTIFDLQRTSNPVGRVAHFIADLLLPMWIGFRLLARAFRWPFINGPPNGSDNAVKFVRFLFSDFGDFCVQFFIHFIGSISDMYAWSNWISSIGLRLLRYFFYVLQPRTVYLFMRSAYYVRDWKDLPAAEQSEAVPMPRAAWLYWGPATFLCFIVGLFFGGLNSGWRNFSIRGSGPVGPVVSALLAGVVSFAFTPAIVTGRFLAFGPAHIVRDRWQSGLVWAMTLVIILMALLTLFQTSAGLDLVDSGGKIAGWVVAFLVLLGITVVGPAFVGEWSHGMHWFAIWLFGLIFPGVMIVIGWWFAICDGQDRQDVFKGRNPATSPYLLPYPAGESWLCGQGFHGFFSHELLDDDGEPNLGNHYSYDLNTDFGDRVLAARTGIVVDVRDGWADHNTEDENSIEVQHLDWVEGHDPGWDLERALTYSGYLHLRRRGAHVSLGQLVRQGRHIADVDDTGVSAMNHLHYSIETGQNATLGTINMPGIFRDQGVRRDRSAGMLPGKPMSLAFFESENSEDTSLSTAIVTVPLVADAGHSHSITFGPADLAPDGTVPDTVTLVSTASGANNHIHQVTLTRAQVEDLFRRVNVTGTSTEADGHVHALGPLPTQPGEFNVNLGNGGPDGHSHGAVYDPVLLAATGPIPANVTITTASGGPAATPHTHDFTLTSNQVDTAPPVILSGSTGPASAGPAHTHSLNDTSQNLLNHRDATFAIADPPPGQLLARRPGLYDLLGEQMVLRVNERATEWFTFGAHRPRLPADLTLDRGPGGAAAIVVSHAGTPATVTVGTDLMPRAAARTLTADLQAAGANVAVRAQPVLVVETRRRGRDASLEVTAAPAGLTLLTPGPAAGSGRLARLDAVTRQELRDVIVADLTQQAGLPVVTVTGAGDSRTITSGGAALTGFGGSTPRLERVLTGLYATATSSITGANPLPLTTGLLRMVTAGGALEVPISGAPARVVITDLGAARLSGTPLVAEPLVVTVRGDAQQVRFADTDVTTAAVAQRIADQAEGVRAWAEGTGVVIETVAAGAQATLVLAKGPGNFPGVTPGAAPALPGPVVLADSTAVSLAELAALVDGAQAEAARPNAPAGVTIPSGALQITATAGAGTPVAVEGPAELMRALGVAPVAGAPTSRVDADETLQLTGLPNTLSLPTGGWLDVTVGPDTWRVDLPAEPARVELACTGLPPGGGQLQLTVNGTVANVTFSAADAVSPHALAARIAADLAGGGPDDDVTVRVATRFLFESAVHGTGDLVVGSAASPGSASAGVLVQGRTDRGRASYPDTTAIGTITANARVEGGLIRTFDAAFTGSRVDVTATDASAITITPAAGDPFGLATGSVTGGPFPLGADSVAYTVDAMSTSTTVEFDAAPARAHTTAGAATIGVPAGGGALTLTTTSPAATVTATTVDLQGVTSLVEAAARLQLEAPHVVAWAVGNGTRLDIETPGGGTGWRLRLEGAPVLVALGFDPGLLDAAGGFEAAGTGNVVDGAAVTRTEVRDVVSTMGGLATFDEAQRFTATGFGPLVITGRNGVPALRSDPPSLAAALGATVAGSTLTATGPFRLEAGRLVLDVGGTVAASCAVWGRRAWLEAPDPLPADPTADLDALKATPITVTVDGTGFTVNLPAAAFPSVEALLSFLNRSAGSGARAWFGIVTRPSGRHIRIESRRRGTGSNVTIALTVPPPRLGFTSPLTLATVPGGGSVLDMASVGALELSLLLGTHRGFGDAPQQTVDVSVAGTDLRMIARGGFRTTLTAPTPPEGLGVVPTPGRSDILTAPYAAPLETGTHLTVLQTADSTTGPALTRQVEALLRAEPARIGPMTLPAALATLDGRTLRLTASGTAFTVAFTGLVAPVDVIDQVERAGEGLVRARIVPVAGPPAGSALLVETIAEGTGGPVALSVDVGASTAFPVLGAPPATSSTGSGNTADIQAVTADEYRAVLAAGRAGPLTPTGTDRTNAAMLPVTPPATGEQFLQVASNRVGCRSIVEPLPLAPPVDRPFAQQLAAGPVALDLDRSAGWGPAARAAVALPPLAAPAALNGDLWITFNDNAPTIDVAPTVDVRVPLAGTLDARGLADAIDRAAVGVGSAAAFPDGVVVVESLAPGLTGRVRVPSAANASTPAVLTALGLAGDPLVDRGWPGAGVGGGRSGFRGYVGDARADAQWDFRFPAGGPAAITLSVTAGQTPAQVAAALDPLLQPGPGNRLGVALVGEDGALYVEFFGQAPVEVTMNPQGNFVQPDQPRAEVVWEGGDRQLEPAFELRPTWILRTFRAVFFDQRGDDQAFIDPALYDPASDRVFDIGWVRPPTSPTPPPPPPPPPPPAPPPPPPPAVGTVQSVQRWAPGRWLFAARADGARSDTFPGGSRSRAYTAAGDMIVSAGTAAVAGRDIAFAHRARYWIGHTPTTGITGNDIGVVSVPLRLVPFGTEFLVDHYVVRG